MTDESPKLTPDEERAVALERIRDVLRVAVVDGEDGPVLDLDTLTRLLLKCGIEYRALNKEIAYNELQMVRDEQNVQGARVHAARAKVGTEEAANEALSEAEARLKALVERERVILDQLWPIKK